jgi:hypothetical protein
MFFAVMVAPLEYVRPELFDEAHTCRLFSAVRSARYVAGRPARCCRYRAAECHRRAAERHRPVERHRILQARRRRLWWRRLPTSQDHGSSWHLTPGRTTGTTPRLTLELLGGRGAVAFRCSTMILYKLFPCDYV